MAKSSIRIFLDSPTNTFWAGQNMTGKIECNLEKAKEITAIKLKFKGAAKTEWQDCENYSANDDKHKHHDCEYCGEEVYFNVVQTVFQGDHHIKLPVGRYEYPFSFQLPSQLPSSFEGTSGNIRYYVKAIIERPWKFHYEDKLYFDVVSLLDLNCYPELRNPVRMSADKTMRSCCCFNKGTVTFNISLPATGFAPGQQISIGAHISNPTNINIEDIRLAVVKKQKFIARLPIRKKNVAKTVLSKSLVGRVGAHGQKAWTTTLCIPDDESYPHLTPCGIIQISYFVEAVAALPFPHSNLVVKVPLTIGAVPLYGVITTFEGIPPPPPYSGLPPYSLVA